MEDEEAQMKPVILTAGDDKFADLISISLSQIKRMGYRAKIYDLGGLGIGQEYHKPTEVTLRDSSVPWDQKIRATRKSSKRQWRLNRKAPAPWKPELIKFAMDSSDHWEHMLWLDGDAVITEPIHEIFRGDYDIALTLRHTQGSLPISRYLNTGIVVVRNTPKAREFMERWVAEQSNRVKGCDQHSLHRLLYSEGVELPANKDGVLEHSQLISFLGATVLTLPGAIYNHTIGSASRIDMAWERGSKIWHLKASYYPHQRELKAQFIREVNEKCQYFHETGSST